MEKTKNCWVIPTDKPSRIFITKKEGLGFDNQMLENIELDCQNQNIYITNDEEIKEGDWTIYLGNLVKVASLEGKTFAKEYCKKIILTTDEQLIKDDIQAIDDEFLEWFVKNPSCEEVEIENVYDKFLNGDKRSVSDFRKKYKINIPKEEPKQCDICKRAPRLEGTNKCESCYSVVRHVLEQDPELKDKLLPDLRKKQETLEEVAEKEFPLLDTQFCRTGATEEENFQLLGHRKSFIKGAKWQAEKMYSEEEVGELLYNVIGEYGKHYGIMIDGKMLNDLFEQFKKK